MNHTIQAFGAVYVLAEGAPKSKKKKKENLRPQWKNKPKVEDLYKEMNKQKPSHLYVRALLGRLASSINGAEVVKSDGDVFLSIVLDDREIIIAPLHKDDSISIVVERLGHNGSLRTTGSIGIDNDTNFRDLAEQIKKFVKRAVSQSI